MSDTYNSLVSADYRTTSNGSVKLVQVTIIIISHLCGVINTVPRGVQIYHQDVTVSIRRSRFETNFIPLDKIQSLLSLSDPAFETVPICRCGAMVMPSSVSSLGGTSTSILQRTRETISIPSVFSHLLPVSSLSSGSLS